MFLRRVLPILITLLTVAAAIAVVVAIPPSPVTPRVARVIHDLGATFVDEPAPAFTLERADSPVPVSLTDYRGQWVFLNFWASWCGPCREEMPSMQRLAERLSDRDFAMIGVSLDTDLVAMRRFLDDVDIHGDEIDILHDPDGEVSRRYGTLLLPETWLVDPDGRIVARFQGGYDWTQKDVLTLLDLLTREGWRG